MTIKPHQPPEDSVREAVSGLGLARAARSRGLHLNAESFHLESEQADDLKLPHPVYFAGLSDMSQQGWLARSRLVAWRYIVGRPGGPQAVVDVGYLHKAGAHKFNSVCYGIAGSETMRIHDQFAELLRLDRDKQFEMRALIIPALSISTIWFKADASGEDILFVMGVTRPGNNVEDLSERMSADQFEEKLTRLAEQKIRKLSALNNPLFEVAGYKE